MNAIKNLVIALALVSTAPAYAWGEREQGIVTGVAGTLLIQSLSKNRAYQYPVYVQQPTYVQPTYVQPPTHYYPEVVYPEYTYRPVYKFVDVYIPECGCYRSIKVRIN